MRLVYPDEELLVDFVLATVATARQYIAEGALNGIELLDEAGLSTMEAVAELARIERGRESPCDM
jgi:hypothetical protein